MEAEPPNVEPPKRNRRWYQFSLRTLLVVVTVLAVVCWWIVKQKKLVDDRQEMLARIVKVYHGLWYFKALPPDAPSGVPGLRRLLGDHGVGLISLPIEADPNLYPVIHDLFPEAQLRVFELTAPAAPISKGSTSSATQR